MGPSKIAGLLAEGLRFFSLGERDGAVASWRQVLALDPGNEIARRYLHLLPDSQQLQESPAEPGWNRVVGERTDDVFSATTTDAWDPDQVVGVHPNRGGDVFDLIEGTPRPALVVPVDVDPQPQSPKDEADTLVEGAGELFALGDFSGSLELIQKALLCFPGHPEALAYLERNEGTLLQMYESRLGSKASRPRVMLRADEIVWLNLDHRAGFVLSQIDGTLSIEDLYDISSLERLDTARILADLVDQGVIAT